MFQINVRIKLLVVVLAMSMVIYVGEFQGIEAQQNLPDGVTVVEMENWTKTREVDEIGDGEKKLNSHIDLSELNENISSEDVEAIDGLYDSNFNLRSISSISNINTQDIKGNKALRTIVSASKTLRYGINELYDYLKSDRQIEFSEDGVITWDLHTRVDDKKTSIEWRMLSCSFNISEEQMKMLYSNEAQALLGIPTDNEYGFELIIPYNDIMSIFLNKEPTTINYTNRSSNYTCYLNGRSVNYKYTEGVAKCTDKSHSLLSNHTDGQHVDISQLNTNNVLDSNIAPYLKSGENTMDILIGNFITSQNLLNRSCGFSKLNLYIIEAPQISVTPQFYKYQNGEIVNFDENYLPKKGEEVHLRIDIENKCDYITLNNLSLSMKVSSEELPLEINANSITYHNTDITDNTRCYIDYDFSNQYTLEGLNSLNPGEKITLMLDDINYTITQSDCKSRYVYIECTTTLNYVRDDLTYVEIKKQEKDSAQIRENRLSIPVSQEYGTLNIACILDDASQEDVSFMLNICGDEDFANLTIKPGQTYKLNNLYIGQYDINLIVPQDYQVVDTDTYSSSIQNTVKLKSTDYQKNIQIKLKKKNNPYFYKNDQKTVDVSFN